MSLGIPREITEGILENSTGTITGGTSKHIPGEMPKGMPGKIHDKKLREALGRFLEEFFDGSLPGYL